MKIVIGCGFIAAALLFNAFAQRYDIAYMSTTNTVARVDRLTGSVVTCTMIPAQLAAGTVTLTFDCSGVLR
jgi:hypothetical protein